MPLVATQNEPLLSFEDIGGTSELAYRSLKYHLQHVVWPVVEGGRPFVDGWHIDYLCEHFQAFALGEIDRLLVSCQPGLTKSLIASVATPTWIWMRSPADRILSLSHSEPLATVHSTARRSVIQSPFYRAHWGKKTELEFDRNRLLDFGNVSKGSMLAAITEGNVTGRAHAREHFWDDPLDVDTSENDTLRRKALSWIGGNVFTRFDNQNLKRIACISQRLHIEDVIQWLKDRLSGWVVVDIDGWPDRRRIYSFPSGRTKVQETHEPVCPERMNEKSIREVSSALDGSDDCEGARFAAQIRQQPRRIGAGSCRYDYWKFWHFENSPLPAYSFEVGGGAEPIACGCVPLPTSFEIVSQSWDLTFDDTERADDVGGGAGGQVGATLYVLDMVAEPMDLDAQLAAIRAMKDKFQETGSIYIEKKANGASAIKTLSGEISGIIGVDPRDSKPQRLRACMPKIRAGNIVLPHPSINPLSLKLIRQCAGEVKKDDLMDMLTQLILQMESEAGFSFC